MSDLGTANVGGGGSAGVSGAAEPWSGAYAERPLGICLRVPAAGRAPVPGRDPRQPDIAWCESEDGCGIQIAPAMARLAAERIPSRTAALASGPVTSLDPGRLHRCCVARSC